MALDEDMRWPRRFWHSRASFIAAAVFVAIVTIVAAALLIVGGGDGNARPGTAQPLGGSTVPPPTPKDSDLSIPVIGPNVTWDTFGGIYVPDGGSTYGPMWRDGPAVGGFARTPRGALLALVNASYRHMAAGDDWRTVVRDEIAPGEGADNWTKMRSQLHGGFTIPDPMQIVAFKFVMWTPDAAVINIATEGGDGSRQLTTGQVAWLGGDWKLVLQSDGSDTPTQTPLGSLDGFVLWGATWQ